MVLGHAAEAIFLVGSAWAVSMSTMPVRWGASAGGHVFRSQGLRVVDEDMMPVPLARITYRCANTSPGLVRTGTDGVAVLNLVGEALVLVEQDGYVPSFLHVPASAVKEESATVECKMLRGTPLAMSVVSADGNGVDGIELWASGIDTHRDLHGSIGAELFGGGPFSGLDFQEALRRRQEINESYTSGRTWIRVGRTGPLGAIEWTIPRTAGKVHVFAKCLAVSEIEVAGAGLAATMLKIDEGLTYPTFQWSNPMGLGAAIQPLKLASFDLSGLVAPTCRLVLEESAPLVGRFEPGSSGGYLSSYSCIEFYSKYLEGSDADVKLLGQGVVNGDGGFSIARLPVRSGRAVGVYCRFNEDAEEVIARIFEAHVVPHREGSQSQRRLMLTPVDGLTRSLDVVIDVKDYDGRSLPIAGILKPKSSLVFELRVIKGTSIVQDGSVWPWSKSVKIAIPPTSRITIEGVPTEHFLLTVRPLFSDLASGIKLSEESDLNGVLARPFKLGSERLSCKINIKLRGQ